VGVGRLSPYIERLTRLSNGMGCKDKKIILSLQEIIDLFKLKNIYNIIVVKNLLTYCK
jgi:hypothetical protein